VSYSPIDAPGDLGRRQRFAGNNQRATDSPRQRSQSRPIGGGYELGVSIHSPFASPAPSRRLFLQLYFQVFADNSNYLADAFLDFLVYDALQDVFASAYCAQDTVNIDFPNFDPADDEGLTKRQCSR
jgi:hypothetical protein